MLQEIDAFLTEFSQILVDHTGLFALLFVIGMIFFGFIGGIIEARRDRKHQERIDLELAKAGVDPLAIKEGRQRKRKNGAHEEKHEKLPPIAAKRIDLVSGFLQAALLAEDREVSWTMIQLAGVTDVILERLLLRATEKITADERRFIEHDAPETLGIVREYERLAAEAKTEVLKIELARTANALKEFLRGFEAYLAKMESDAATRIAILTDTRRQIALFTQPMALPEPDQLDHVPLVVPGRKQKVPRRTS